MNRARAEQRRLVQTFCERRYRSRPGEACAGHRHLQRLRTAVASGSFVRLLTRGLPDLGRPCGIAGLMAG
jgi:hypothetical protein